MAIASNYDTSSPEIDSAGPSLPHPINTPHHTDQPTIPGQTFQADMGFVRGTKYQHRDIDGQLITSMDGYNSYLIVVDRATRYTWIFLSKTKTPPVHLLKGFLQTHGTTQPVIKRIRTDKGGELWGSYELQRTLQELNWVLEPTAPDASFQNGVAERPNRSLADMMRSILHGAQLGPEYWSWAILHAAYLKNRLPHRTLGRTPHEAYTGKRPNLRYLRVFGCPVTIRIPGRRQAKLDQNATNGIFLGYTATTKNIYYFDTDTKRVKTGTHVTFDEAGYTIPPTHRTLLQQRLQASGIEQVDLDLTERMENKSTEPLIFQCLTEHATIPDRDNDDTAGYNIYSARHVIIQPNSTAKVPTDLALQPPHNAYCQLLSRIHLLTNHQIEVKASTVDGDSTGNLHVVLHNASSHPYAIQKGDRIAHLIIYPIIHPELQVLTDIEQTAQRQQRLDTGNSNTIPQCAMIRQLNVETQPALGHVIDRPYNVWLSPHPFHNLMTLRIPLTGTDPTLGMRFAPTTHRERIQLVDIVKGTPAAKTPRWRSTIKRALLLHVNNEPVASEADAIHIINTLKQQGHTEAECGFATIRQHGVHPTDGSLMLYYDQLNVIAQHLASGDIRHISDTPTAPSPPPAPNIPHRTNPSANESSPLTSDATLSASITPTAIPRIDPKDLGRFFTLKELKKRPDWPLWRQARFTMLDSYHSQGMFSDPMPAPAKANIHHMLWRYTLKMCGTRKARMVCDGSARQGTITLGHTFANSLDAPSERLFWAVVAKKGLTAYGADCSNAFAEAPPPKHPLYMRIDEAFKDWWEHHLGHPPIPPEYTVVRVNNAIQGHPESPRLWEKLIDRILRTIGLQPTKHEPCLYHGSFQGHYTLFMRQVDDFAVATNNHSTAMFLIEEINQHLRLPIHILGVVQRYNGMDITQGKHYVKITCERYIKKMSQSYPWLQDIPQRNLPIPFPSDHKYIQKLIHSPETILTDAERSSLETKMGLKYRKAMGEIMFPMIKCRPDIAAHAIILSQFMNNPSEVHYKALKDVLIYLTQTAAEGIHYWRDKPHPTLPEFPMPTLHPDNYTLTTTSGTNSKQLVGFVDSDWATNTKKRTSLTGMILMYAGGAIGYKSKFQSIIAHSTTEAEFVAACETAKHILFYRSLMQEIGLEQTDATTLFEDNTGALLMANAQQPTKRTRHMDIKHFALLDWVEQDLLLLEHIDTSDNIADAMTKTLGRTLFYRHYDTYMGLRQPNYCALRRLNSPILQQSGTYHAHCRRFLHKCQQPSGAPIKAPLCSRRGTRYGGGTRHTRT